MSDSEKLYAVKKMIKNLNVSLFEENKAEINAFYDELTQEEQIIVFKFNGKYPKENQREFEDKIIEKYVLKGGPEMDYIMMIVINKQKMFDNLLDLYCFEKNDEKQFYILEKIIFLLLEYGRSIKITREHINLVTKVMRQQFTFVLASFFSKQPKILIGTAFASLYLPRLEIYIERMNEKFDEKLSEKDQEISEVENFEDIFLPDTFQEAINLIETDKLDPDCLIFYIFTAPTHLLMNFKSKLLQIFLTCSSPIFITVFCERTKDWKLISNYLIKEASEKEKLQILESFKLLMDMKWCLSHDLRKAVISEVEKGTFSDRIVLKINEIFL